MSDTEQAFIERWQQKRDWLELIGASANASTLIDELLTEVETLCRERGEETLDLASASALSGYTRDHLSRLLRAGAIPNAGRRGAPRIQRCHLPRRPGTTSPR